MAMLDQYSFVEAGLFDPVLHGADTAGAGELPAPIFFWLLSNSWELYLFFFSKF